MMVKGSAVRGYDGEESVAVEYLDEEGVTEDIIVSEGAMEDMMMKKVSWRT